ncbi:hypothetical protein PA27867_1008 [Cryobacterium arcticum]|uniref:Uncharacterized protein n=1 Tax=Cryobacterium arcticum TaxID=670052 RepID=A0A1B1BH77_9MICO|nr:hypothetical protein PA27867_1008 [Cryobacterium arcticum]
MRLTQPPRWSSPSRPREPGSGTLPRHPQTNSPGLDKLDRRRGRLPQALASRCDSRNPLAGRACRDPAGRSPGLCRGIRRPTHRVSTSSTDDVGASSRRSRVDATHATPALVEPVETPGAGLRDSAAASTDQLTRFRPAQLPRGKRPADRVTGSRQARPPTWEPPPGARESMRLTQPPRWSSLSRPRGPVSGTLPRHPQTGAPGLGRSTDDVVRPEDIR